MLADRYVVMCMYICRLGMLMKKQSMAPQIFHRQYCMCMLHAVSVWEGNRNKGLWLSTETFQHACTCKVRYTLITYILTEWSTKCRLLCLGSAVVAGTLSSGEPITALFLDPEGWRRAGLDRNVWNTHHARSPMTLQ